MRTSRSGPFLWMVILFHGIGGDAAGQDTTAAAQQSGTAESPPAEAPPARVVQDTTATGELRALFSRIEELTDVEVTVEGGVARLTGTTLAHEARATAVDLTVSRPEVVYVDDRIVVETSVAARTGPVVDQLIETALDWTARIPLFIAAALVVALFGLLAHLVASIRWLYARLGTTAFMQDLTRRAIKFVIWAAGLLVALELLDATALVGALLGAAGVAGLAFGFAFRNIAENWLAGILLGLRRPFDLDDLVAIGGSQGKVVRLTHSDTVLMTPDGNHLRIPNATVYNGLVENFTRNPRRRFRLRLSLPREVDVDRARATLLASLDECPVLRSPPPAAPLVEVGDTHLVMELHGWVDQTRVDFERARSIAYRAAKEALLASGFTPPTSEHWLHMVPEEGGRSARPPTDAEDLDAGSGRGAAPEVAPEPAAPDDAVQDQVEEDRARSDDVNLLDRP